MRMDLGMTLQHPPGGRGEEEVSASYPSTAQDFAFRLAEVMMIGVRGTSS